MTLGTVILARRLSGIPVNVTMTSFPEITGDTEPIAVDVASTEVTVPIDVTGILKLKTIVCPAPMARGSTSIRPEIAVNGLMAIANVPAAPCTFRETTETSESVTLAVTVKLCDTVGAALKFALPL